MPQNTKINCPKCGHEFNVEDALAHQIEEKYRQELNNKITTIESDYKAKEISLAKKEEALKQKQTEIDKQIRKS